MKVYVLTCDKYRHLIEPFSHLMNKYWPNQEVIVIGFQAPQADLPSNFVFLSLGKEEELPWADRLLKAIDYLGHDHFVFLLEDYFLTGSIDDTEVKRRYNIIKSDPNIGKIDLSEHIYMHGADGMFDETLFISEKKNSQYTMSFQPAIWNKDMFKRFFVRGETSWQSEVNASRRCSEGYEGLLLGGKNTIFPNVNAVLKGVPNISGLKAITDYEAIPGIKGVLEMGSVNLQ